MNQDFWPNMEHKFFAVKHFTKVTFTCSISQIFSLLDFGRLEILKKFFATAYMYTTFSMFIPHHHAPGGTRKKETQFCKL